MSGSSRGSHRGRVDDGDSATGELVASRESGGAGGEQVEWRRCRAGGRRRAGEWPAPPRRAGLAAGGGRGSACRGAALPPGGAAAGVAERGSGRRRRAGRELGPAALGAGGARGSACPGAALPPGRRLASSGVGRRGPAGGGLAAWGGWGGRGGVDASGSGCRLGVSGMVRGSGMKGKVYIRRV
ncbi:hypothetical protein BS78_02G035900 [Paspalum vaginatum]|nr:hypothetical protein BS78_02G035900 [Paspalum vaginatum]